jgi:hypothetical protein
MTTALFPKSFHHCAARAEGSKCVAVVDVGGNMDGCIGHCRSHFGSELASAEIDRLVYGQCCCHDAHSCSCQAPNLIPFLPVELAMVDGHVLPDTVCPPSVVEGGYVDQCRPLDHLTSDNFQYCHSHLSNTSLYHLLDVPTLDKSPNSLLIPIATVVEVAMNPSCASNVLSMVCNAVFRECRPVEDRSSKATLWLPSLLCKSECEAHLQVWNECLATIEESGKKAEFDAQMHDVITTFEATADLLQMDYPHVSEDERVPFSLQGCDINGGVNGDISDGEYFLGFILGRVANTITEGMQLSWTFPASMATDALYPATSSMYTSSDGTVYDVPCFIPSADPNVLEAKCPDPFLPPVDESHDKPCVNPCPSPVYTTDEYSAMWLIYSIVSIVGLLLNLFMAATWYISGRRHFKAIPFQLKNCVFLGILYGLVDTLPVVLLKFDLPCSCDTDECVGDSLGCFVNRSSTYLLMAISINLCSLTHNLFSALSSSSRRHSQFSKAVPILVLFFPMLLMVVAYLVETDDTNVSNGKLNISRHAFKCVMRFPDTGAFCPPPHTHTTHTTHTLPSLPLLTVFFFGPHVFVALTSFCPSRFTLLLRIPTPPLSCSNNRHRVGPSASPFSMEWHLDLYFLHRFVGDSS